MTKNFCDICEQPVSEFVSDFDNRTVQHKGNTGIVVNASVVFSIARSRDSAISTKDLCRSCAYKLVQEIADKLKP